MTGWPLRPGGAWATAAARTRAHDSSSATASSTVDDRVVLVDVHDPRHVRRELLLGVRRVRDHDHRVARVHEPRGRAVHLDLAAAARARDRVGLEARAVVDVDHVHLLVLADVGGVEQVLVDRDRADVVQVAAGYRRRWIFDFSIVRFISAGLPGSVLSISRARPTRAATARTSGRSPARRVTGRPRSGARGTRARSRARRARLRAAARTRPRVRCARRRPRVRRLERAAERQRALALLVGQVGVARAEREPVRRRARSGRPRSRPGCRGRATSRRITSACWASFWPK